MAMQGNQATVTSIERVKRIDVVRGVAILSVFLHHYWANIAFHVPVFTAFREKAVSGGLGIWGLIIDILEHSSFGVKLFWFVSGFCIHASFLKWENAQKLKNEGEVALKPFWGPFFWRRFWRVYPPYFVALILCFLLAYQAEAFSVRGLTHFSIHALLIHIYFPAFIGNISVPFWSVAVEMQRYLLYPILLALRKIGGMAAACGLAIAVSLSLKLWGGNLDHSWIVVHSPFFYWFEWVVGAGLAERYYQGKRVFPWPRTSLLVTAAFFAAAFVFQVPNGVKSVAMVAFYAAGFEWYLNLKSPLNKAESVMAPAGVISYSIYLIHTPPLFFGVMAFEKIPALEHMPLAWGLIGVALFLAICALSRGFYLIVERPSADLGRWKPWTRKTTRKPAASLEASAGSELAG